MVWATKRIKYCSILLVVGFAVAGLAGVTYLAATTLMPYDLEYIGISSAIILNFNPNLHNLIVILMKSIGAYSLIVCLWGMTITLIPFRRGERWAWISLFAFGLMFSISALAATFYLGVWVKWVMLVTTALLLVAILIPFQDFFRKK